MAVFPSRSQEGPPNPAARRELSAQWADLSVFLPRPADAWQALPGSGNGL